MSSFPGNKLEDFLAWNFNLVVEGRDDVSANLAMAELLGNITRRPRLTEIQFIPLVQYFEPKRNEIETTLANFDGETQSWRDYGGTCFNCVTKEDIQWTVQYLMTMQSSQETSPMSDKDEPTEQCHRVEIEFHARFGRAPVTTFVVGSFPEVQKRLREWAEGKTALESYNELDRDLYLISPKTYGVEFGRNAIATVPYETLYVYGFRLLDNPTVPDSVSK